MDDRHDVDGAGGDHRRHGRDRHRVARVLRDDGPHAGHSHAGRPSRGRRDRARAVKSDFVDLPDDLRRVVDDALAAIPDGDARRLLLGVIVQARPILASRSTTFDAAAESASRTNVESLVAACCGTAIDLSRLDAASSAKPATARDPSLDARFAAARDMLVKRMSDATAALTALYAAGLEHGTPASNRVAELATEISADAKARGAAATEIAQLLGDH